MAGIEVTIEGVGLKELLADLANLDAEMTEALEDTLAEQAILFNQNLRGGGPGGGVTPFDTGRLLTSGDLVQRGVNLTFINDASYAEWVRKSGDEIGQYQRDVTRLFAERFGEELEKRWEDVLTDKLEDVLE